MTQQDSQRNIIAAINSIAEDIVKQTTYRLPNGQYGGAAMYADADTSAAQQARIADALGYMTAANILLREFAVNGGLSLQKTLEIFKDDKCTRIDINDVPEATITKTAKRSTPEEALRLLVCRTCADADNGNCDGIDVKNCPRIKAIAEDIKSREKATTPEASISEKITLQK